MKILALIILIIPTLAFSQNKSDAQKYPLPAEIRQYYEDVNFVNSLSTPRERTQIVSDLEKGTDPQEQGSERLKQIAEKLSAINDQVLKSNASMPNSMKTSRSTSSVIYNIGNVKVDENAISIKLDALQLSMYDNIALIKRYEEQTDQTSSQCRDLESNTSVGKEVHEWIKVDGQWFKKEVHKVLVE